MLVFLLSAASCPVAGLQLNSFCHGTGLSFIVSGTAVNIKSRLFVSKLLLQLLKTKANFLCLLVTGYSEMVCL